MSQFLIQYFYPFAPNFKVSPEKRPYAMHISCIYHKSYNFNVFVSFMNFAYDYFPNHAVKFSDYSVLIRIQLCNLIWLCHYKHS